jgi:hypothetical protein
MARVTATEYARSLRLLADFWEQNPHLAGPYDPDVCYAQFEGKQQAAMITRLLGQAEKQYDDTLFKIVHKFGCIEARFLFTRELVCERKVVGTKVIPEHVIPAREEIHIPERTEEIVEWDCGSLLASDMNRIAIETEADEA